VQQWNNVWIYRIDILLELVNLFANAKSSLMVLSPPKNGSQLHRMSFTPFKLRSPISYVREASLVNSAISTGKVLVVWFSNSLLNSLVVLFFPSPFLLF
jgi:hypothetical protein